MAFRLLVSTSASRNVVRAATGSSRLIMRRQLSQFVDLDDDLNMWPRSKVNTVLNVCNQGERMVVERLGKLNSIQEGGWFFAIPFLDNIRFVIDMREKALAISPQAAITKDNVHVQVSGNLYCQFVDPEKAAYGSGNPIYAVKQHAQSSMRAAIGERELDLILKDRANLNTVIRTTVQEAADAWGLEIKRYEITEIQASKEMNDIMGRQAASERERRSKVLEAEGSKQAQALDSEGIKIRMKNESEGTYIKIKNEAEARKVQLILEAEAEAAVIELRAKAQAEAILVISKSLQANEHAQLAARLSVAREYIDMYSDIGQKSNTMIFNERPADLNALMAQASAVMNVTGANTRGGLAAAKSNQELESGSTGSERS